VQAIALAASNANFEGQACDISGWGQTGGTVLLDEYLDDFITVILYTVRCNHTFIPQFEVFQIKLSNCYDNDIQHLVEQGNHCDSGLQSYGYPFCFKLDAQYVTSYSY